MVTLEITAAERESGQIAAAHLRAATTALREDGFVVLANVVDLGHLALLRERMIADVQQIVARPDVPYNFNVGNIQQDPPPFPPYLFRDILLNDIVIAVTKEILGPGLQNGFYSGNTALPGGQPRQPVHADSGQLWPNLTVATPPYALVVNVPVVDMTPQNGSTELWPGTHLDTTVFIQQGDIKVPEPVLAERRKVVPPLQPTVAAGSVLIRDIRLWHAGMPNYTYTPRPMIAMIHFVSWWHIDKPLVFPKGTESFFEHPHLTTRACFVDEPIDYLHRHQAYDFQT